MASSSKNKQAKEGIQLAELENRVNELTEALQRERADAVNVRRRAEEDRLKMANSFKAAVISELLDFIDNFDRALAHTPKTVDKVTADWLQGLNSIHKQLWQSLESLGVKRLKTVDEPFDPRYHEAVQMDNDGKGTHEVVTAEFRSGYMIDDEVIRHAMVKVANK